MLLEEKLCFPECIMFPNITWLGVGGGGSVPFVTSQKVVECVSEHCDVEHHCRGHQGSFGESLEVTRVHLGGSLEVTGTGTGQ